MAKLAPSLKELFRELDVAWPKRDRRTDGWYRNCVWKNHGTDHCPDSKGMVHAIDIDKDGINADWVVARLIQMDGVVRYVIWNRHIWQYKNNWRRENYTGTSNPHTDHIHVSIEHNYIAENWPGGFDISPIQGFPSTPTPSPGGIPPGWDYSQSVSKTADLFTALTGALTNYARALKNLRQ